MLLLVFELGHDVSNKAFTKIDIQIIFTSNLFPFSLDVMFDLL